MKDKGVQLKNTIWAKPKVEKLQLLKGIFNIAKDVATTNLTGIPADVLDAIGAIKLSDGPGMVGWKLIGRSLADALTNLVVENKPDFDKKRISVAQLDKDLNGILESEKFFVKVDFFKHPDKLPFIDKIKPTLSKFLSLIGFNKNESENILNRLPGYFVFSLINEWRLNYKYYQTLREALVTPFDEAARRENEWYLYSKWLDKQVDRPMFSESFSLRQIYVPLRSFYNEKIKNKDTGKSFEDRTSKAEDRKIVVDLEKELLQWIDKADKNDGIRIIRGGPGYGKSSFLKMFAAGLANAGKRVLFIPLHLFEVKDDLIEAVRNFIRYDEFLTIDPFEEDRLIIIFDGLDELSMQGTALADVAGQFVREVERKTTHFNNRKIKLQVLISGRDVVVQQNEDVFRKDGQILRLLPYYLNKYEGEGLIDKGKLLKEDQRNIWWQNYGKLKGKDYKGLPRKLKNRELDEITAQPLLNYLVALSYERGKIDFSAGTNLNNIYNDLLDAVYNRNYAEAKTHQTVKKLKSFEFSRMLEEIAAASWHGDGRTTTVAEIEKHFKDSGLKRLLHDFTKEAEKGVITLLTAFYFRQAGQDVKGAQTFEFTHKSFGEYLTSKRIVNKITQIHKKTTENEAYYDEGWNVKECLTEWAKLFGPKELDEDLVKFIRNELRLLFSKDLEEAKHIQQTIIKLINHMLKEGMPLEELVPRPSYYIENEQAINSEKALLIILGTIANLTDVVSDIQWPSTTTFGEWIGRLIGQRTETYILVQQFINHLNLNNSVLDMRDLFSANLQRSNLSFASMYSSNLVNANLARANLTGTNLGETNLGGAVLVGADLEGANLVSADLMGANLEEANLTKANLTKAVLKRADLTGADLEGAIGLDPMKLKQK